MQALFNSKPTIKTFDTQKQDTTIQSYNEQQKNAKYSLSPDIIEKPEMIEAEPDLQVDFSVEYPKEITIVPDKHDVTKMIQNQSAIMQLDKYNPILKHDSELLREQARDKAPHLMEDHIPGNIGVDVTQQMNQIKVQANKASALATVANMQANIQPRAPQPIEPSYFRNVDPNYGLLKQGLDKKMETENHTTNWYKSQVRDDQFNIKKRLIPTQTQGLGSVVMAGMPNNAVTTSLGTHSQRNKFRPLVNTRVSQKDMNAQMIMMSAEKYQSLQYPTQQLLQAKPTIPKFGRAEYYRPTMNMTHSIHANTVPTVSIPQFARNPGNGRQNIAYNHNTFTVPQMAGSMATAYIPPRAQQMTVLGQSPNQYLNDLSMLTNEAVKYGQNEFNLGEALPQ